MNSLINCRFSREVGGMYELAEQLLEPMKFILRSYIIRFIIINSVTIHKS
jgi:hypothetical protein